VKRLILKGRLVLAGLAKTRRRLFWIDRSGLRRSLRVRCDARKQYRADCAFARSQGLTGNDLQRAYSVASFEAAFAEDAYSDLLTDSLVSQAEKRDLPVPDESDESGYWTNGYNDSSWRLSDEGIMLLRAAIRAYRRERWMFGFQVASIVIGVLGATAAVLSVLLVLITS